MKHLKFDTIKGAWFREKTDWEELLSLLWIGILLGITIALSL